MEIKSIFFIIYFVLLLTCVSAQLPFSSGEFTEGLAIEYPQIKFIEQNSDVTFSFHVYNQSNGVLITDATASCIFHLYNSTGFNLIESPASSSGIDFDAEVKGGNFSQLGTYSYIIQCNTSTQGGYSSVGLEVTPNGEEPNMTKGIIYIGVIVVMLLILVLIVYAYYDTDNPAGRTAGIGFMYLILWGLVYMVWQVSFNYLTSAPFVIAFFKWLWIILTVGIFPMFIGLFMWYFYMVITIKEITDLMNKGMSMEEAKYRIGRNKKKKW